MRKEIDRVDYRSGLMLWTYPGETLTYAGIGLAIGLLVGGWVADRQRSLS